MTRLLGRWTMVLAPMTIAPTPIRTATVPSCCQPVNPARRTATNAIAPNSMTNAPIARRKPVIHAVPKTLWKPALASGLLSLGVFVLAPPQASIQVAATLLAVVLWGAGLAQLFAEFTLSSSSTAARVLLVINGAPSFAMAAFSRVPGCRADRDSDQLPGTAWAGLARRGRTYPLYLSMRSSAMSTSMSS